MNSLPTEGMLTQEQAAEYLGITRVQIRNWRRLGYGPQFARISARGDVRYTREWLDEWRADVEAGRAWWPIRGPRKNSKRA